MANAELVNGGASIWTFTYYTKCTSETSWQGRRVRGIPLAAQERYQSPVSRSLQHLREDQSPVWLLMALRPTPQPPPLPRLGPMWLGTVRTDPNRADSLLLGFWLMPPRGEGQEAGVWSQSSTRFLSSGRGRC